MKRWCAILLLVATPALAEPGGDHFPQPVRVGTLIGQKLIGPSESQPLLGRVDAVSRDAGGAITVRVTTWSWLPWGGRTVDVPLQSVSFLGPQLALTGLSQAQLDALPASAASPSLSADDTIRVGLVKPFH